jgi:Lon protease-like protein
MTFLFYYQIKKMENLIPIFPLKLVVFPNSSYPLHIFEPRYKKMITYCIDNNTGFGIVASFDKRISDVGVYVLITDVLKKYDNGEFDILVKGISRFLINETKLHPDGYFISTVEEYNDRKVSIDNSLLQELKDEFEKILELANYKLEDKFWKQYSQSEFKSFKIAEKSGLDYAQQQELLILRNENARLNYLIKYFSLLKNKMSNSETLNKIVMGDGFINE